MRKFDLRRHRDRFRLILATFELLEKQGSPVKYRNYEVTWKVEKDRNYCKIMISDKNYIACYYETSWYVEPGKQEKVLEYYDFAAHIGFYNKFSWQDLRSIYHMIGGTDGQKK